MKTPVHILLVFTLFLLAFGACSDKGTSSDEMLVGSYAYSAFDSLGTKITTGTLTLLLDGERITGAWRFTDGRSGDLVGSVSKGVISLNLNPKFIDNNLILRGTLAGNVFSGVWQHIGYPGVMAQGTFTARRQ